MIQKWECEGCGKKGSIRHKKTDRIIPTVIEKAFEHHRKVSPDCPNHQRLQVVRIN